MEVTVSFGKMLKKVLVFRGVPFLIIASLQVLVPVAYYREGGTTCHLRLIFFYLRSQALDWLSQYYKYTVVKQNRSGAEWVELIVWSYL